MANNRLDHGAHRHRPPLAPSDLQVKEAVIVAKAEAVTVGYATTGCGGGGSGSSGGNKNNSGNSNGGAQTTINNQQTKSNGGNSNGNSNSSSDDDNDNNNGNSCSSGGGRQWQWAAVAVGGSGSGKAESPPLLLTDLPIGCFENTTAVVFPQRKAYICTEELNRSPQKNVMLRVFLVVFFLRK
jgi:hypothetical protein